MNSTEKPDCSAVGSRRSRVLIVRWGDMRVHDLNLAKALAKHHDVEFAVATPHYGYRGAMGRGVIDEAMQCFEVYEFTIGKLGRQTTRLYRLLDVCGIRLPILLVGAGFPGRLACHIKKGSYDWVLPIEQHSLYCAWRALRTFTQDFSKLLYYSLEVQTPADPDVNSQMRRMLEEEKRILGHVGGIIIQDVNRLKVLGDDLLQFIPIVYLLPLFSDRPVVTERSNVLRETFGISESKKILLYFGALYAERMIDRIVREFCDADRKDVVIVLHNPQMTPEEAGRLESMGQDVIASTKFLSEDDLDRLVASADMGIALYDNDKPNTRYTAFSSEKVTTYLRCGIPFIAFDNESFRELSEAHACCALIVSIDELGKAMDKLLSNHAHYAREAQLAYRHIFYRTEVNLGVALSGARQRTNGRDLEIVPDGLADACSIAYGSGQGGNGSRQAELRANHMMGDSK